MNELKRLHKVGVIMALALTLPAAYGAGPSESTDVQPAVTVHDSDVSVSRMEQLVDGRWTAGAAAQVEGSTIPFRLVLDVKQHVAAGSRYVVEIEYTRTLAKDGVTANGYLGVADFTGAPIVSETDPVSGSSRPGETTEYRAVTIEVPGPGPLVLSWNARLGEADPAAGRAGPASISGALVQMRHRGSDRTVPTLAVVSEPEPGPCSMNPFCDPICTGDGCGGPECTGDDCGEPECTGDDCGELEPVCTGTVVVSTVDTAGTPRGPSSVLVDSTLLALADGRSDAQEVACGQVLVALTDVPSGYQVAGTSSGESVGAASAHLAQEAVTVSSGAATQVVFVLDIVVDQDETQEDEAVIEVVVDDEVIDQDPTEVDAVVDREDQHEQGPARSTTDEGSASPAPDPTGDPRPVAAGPAADDSGTPSRQELPRTGTDAPSGSLLAAAFILAGMLTLRVSGRPADGRP